MSEDTKEDTTFRYTEFKEGSKRGVVVTFGLAEHIYENLLEQSEIKKGSSNFPQRAVMLGCASIESLDEFVTFIRNLNPNCQVIIADLSGKVLKSLKSYVEGLPSEEKEGIDFIQTDGRALSIANNSVDAVFTNLLLHNIGQTDAGYLSRTEQIQGLLTGVLKSLKPGGGLFMVESHEFWSKYRYEDLGQASISSQKFLKKLGYGSVGYTFDYLMTKEFYLQRHNIPLESYLKAKRLHHDNDNSPNSWGGKHRSPNLYIATYGIKPASKTRSARLAT